MRRALLVVPLPKVNAGGHVLAVALACCVGQLLQLTAFSVGVKFVSCVIVTTVRTISTEDGTFLARSVCIPWAAANVAFACSRNTFLIRSASIARVRLGLTLFVEIVQIVCAVTIYAFSVLSTTFLTVVRLAIGIATKLYDIFSFLSRGLLLALAAISHTLRVGFALLAVCLIAVPLTLVAFPSTVRVDRDFGEIFSAFTLHGGALAHFRRTLDWLVRDTNMALSACLRRSIFLVVRFGRAGAV